MRNYLRYKDFLLIGFSILFFIFGCRFDDETTIEITADSTPTHISDFSGLPADLNNFTSWTGSSNYKGTISADHKEKTGAGYIVWIFRDSVADTFSGSTYPDGSVIVKEGFKNTATAPSISYGAVERIYVMRKKAGADWEYAVYYSNGDVLIEPSAEALNGYCKNCHAYGEFDYLFSAYGSSQ